MRNRKKFVIIGVTAATLGAGASELGGAVSAEPAVPADPKAPLASVSGSTPGVRLSLMSLRKSGKRVTVKLRLSAAKDAPANDYDHIGIDIDGGSMADNAEGIRLIDNVSAREMEPLIDGEGRCLCSSQIDGIAPGQTIDVYATFAAPGDSVSRLSIAVPSFPSIDDVRIEQVA